MDSRRPRFPTKAAWALAKAAEIRQQADAIPMVSSMDWRGVRRRAEARRHLEGKARRFEMMARRLQRVAGDDLELPF